MPGTQKQKINLYRSALFALAITGGITSQSSVASPEPPRSSATVGVKNCTLLTALPLANATVTGAEIISGHYIPESELADNLRGARSAPIDDLPETCRVTITVEPQIKIEVWLPTRGWNRRFQAVGGGGYSGFISYDTLATAVKSGFASASTDTGHRGSPSEGQFALQDGHPQAGLIADFAYRSQHEMTVKAKQLIAAYYNAAPDYSYWNGCSTGGRQGLMEAQRYPEDYDGILAAAPAIQWDRFIPAELWPQIVMQQELGRPIGTKKLTAITSTVVAAFDEADGVKDGVIRNPSKIHVSDDILKTAGLDDREISTIRKIWQGPRGRQDEFMWYGLEPGAPLAALADTPPFPIPVDYMKFWMGHDGWQALDYDGYRDFFSRSVEEYRPVLGTDNPNLSEFKRAGGKLIIWHGWNDQLIFPQGSIHYYEAVKRAMGGDIATEGFARLYMAPGVEHCRGGEGPDTINGMDALIKWVEHGEAPEHLTAAKVEDGEVRVTRPLCAFPQEAVYRGQGRTNDEKSFACEVVDPTKT